MSSLGLATALASQARAKRQSRSTVGIEISSASAIARSRRFEGVANLVWTEDSRAPVLIPNDNGFPQQHVSPQRFVHGIACGALDDLELRASIRREFSKFLIN